MVQKTKKVGHMMKRLTCREEEEKKKSTPYQNTGSNLAEPFYLNHVGEQLPHAGHKQGFAVAGWLNHPGYLLGLCGCTLFPILKRNKFGHFQPCH